MTTGQAQRGRVLVIGIDGATFDLLIPWMKEGFMPNLAAIWGSGGHGLLRSTIPPITASAWASFQTGKNPGKHGLFDFTQYCPGSYDTSFVNANSVQAEPLWQVLSRHGKRVVVINVPITYPPKPVNGYMISGMLTPSVDVEFTYPPDLYRQMVREIGDYQIFLPARAALQMSSREFVDRLRYLSRKRADAALFLMRRADWDFFMVHFQSSDVLQHALWSHLDPAHPQYRSIPESDREYARSYYAELDDLVGQIVEQAGTDATVIVMSDHGFGPARKRFHINQWLAGEGFLAIGAGAVRKRALARAESFIRRIDFLKLRRRLLTPFSKRERFFQRLTQESLIDWRATRAYALPCAAVGRLQINCKDREPLGTVQQGTEYESLRDAVAERLLLLRDPETGDPVVEQVLRREDIYGGPALELMPDLVALPAGGYQIATRFKQGLLFSPLAADFTGTHRMDGILMMAGPHIVPNRRIEGAQIVDLFPTILALLDIPAPPDLDGKALLEALTDDYLRAHPMRWEEQEQTPSPQPLQDTTYSPDDASAIEDRLKGLGYLD